MKQLTLISLVVLAGACGPSEKPNFTYMPDMAYSPGRDAQEAQPLLDKAAMRTPVEGTVARGFEAYRYAKNPEGSRALKNPLNMTRSNLEQGRDLYNVYCIVCHGKMGEGDGSVVPPFPRPPSLQTAKIRDWPDGRIFHVITMGQNLMPSYSAQIDPQDRWKIVHYLRVLYRAKHPTKSDLQKAKDW